MEVRVGAGAYVCGEETSLLESLEGKRGEVRAKPPLPGPCRPVRQADRHQQCAVACQRADHHERRRPPITAISAWARSRGTMPIQLAGNIKHGGLFETAFGITPRRARRRYRRRHADQAVRCARCRSAARSAPISRARCSTTPFDYEAFTAADGLIGHGGIVVFDDTVDMAKQARFAMEFCAIESCGKCTPCRIGSARGVELVDKIMAGEDARGKHHRARRSLQHHEVRFALRAGRVHPLPGDERAHPFPRGFRRFARSASKLLNEDLANVADPGNRLRHPALQSQRRR